MKRDDGANRERERKRKEKHPIKKVKLYNVMCFILGTKHLNEYITHTHKETEPHRNVMVHSIANVRSKIVLL